MLSFFKKRTPITTLFDEHFVDFHSHLLPGIDDGAKNMETSIALIKRMHSYGIKNFITTPHIMSGVYDNTPELILEKQQELQSHLKSIGLTNITLGAAAEYMLDAGFEKLLEEKKLLTLSDTKILVEMSYHSPPLNLYEQLFNIQMAGYQPILAHPERYAFYHRNKKEYTKLKEAGCLFQLNLLSLSTYYGKDVQKVAIHLLKEGLIDFAGSDTHHMRHLDALENINQPKIIELVKPVLKNNQSLM